MSLSHKKLKISIRGKSDHTLVYTDHMCRLKIGITEKIV
jgi:hypothetical protein